MTDQEAFRERLRAATRRVGRKVVTRPDGTNRADVADDDDSISQGGLTKILRGERKNPGVFTVKSIATGAGVTVGELLGEKGFDVSAEDQEELRRFIRWAEAKLLKSAPPKLDARDSPNAVRITLVEQRGGEVVDFGGRVSRRKAKAAEPGHKGKRQDAAATPNIDASALDESDAPEREIPNHYWELGARECFRTQGDSMIGYPYLISERDLLFVRPTNDAASLNGKVVVCRVNGATYLKILDVSQGAIRLLSANERYGPMVIDEDVDRFELVGIVLGRSGYTPS